MSGNVVWRGTCGKGCHVDVETFSGQTTLVLDPRSSFQIKAATRGGGLTDQLGLKVERAPDRPNLSGVRLLRARHGAGAGEIRVQSYSGGLTVRKP